LEAPPACPRLGGKKKWRSGGGGIFFSLAYKGAPELRCIGGQQLHTSLWEAQSPSRIAVQSRGEEGGERISQISDRAGPWELFRAGGRGRLKGEFGREEGFLHSGLIDRHQSHVEDRPDKKGGELEEQKITKEVNISSKKIAPTDSFLKQNTSAVTTQLRSRTTIGYAKQYRNP